MLDEVDAELDTQYREMVTKLIKKQNEQQGERCQIFCTTFKPEILRVATAEYFAMMQKYIYYGVVDDYYDVRGAGVCGL